jgi:hypothetical protein
MWDIFVASVMTLLFASLRMALFAFFWLLLLMAVPTILGVM